MLIFNFKTGVVKKINGMKLVLTFNSNLFIQGETTETQKVHSIFERQKSINSKWREREREICQFWAGGGGRD